MPTLKQQIVSVARRGDHTAAVMLARSAVAQNPAGPEAWALLSHAYEIGGDLTAAIDASTRAVELEPAEPAHYFQRGWLRLVQEGPAQALDDLQRVLSLGDSYYCQMALFLSAVALQRLGRPQEALARCAAVPDGFVLHSGIPFSKAELMAECRHEAGVI